MGHIKDHYKPVPSSPISNKTEAKAVSRSDEEEIMEKAMEHSQDTSLPTEEVQEEQALEQSQDSQLLTQRSASSFQEDESEQGMCAKKKAGSKGGKKVSL